MPNEGSATSQSPLTPRGTGGSSLQKPHRKRPAHFTGAAVGFESILIFLTVCRRHQKPLLANNAAARLTIESWQAAKAPANQTSPQYRDRGRVACCSGKACRLRNLNRRSRHGCLYSVLPAASATGRFIQNPAAQAKRRLLQSAGLYAAGPRAD